MSERLSLLQRLKHGIQLYPVTAGALIALAVAAAALVLVLDEQSDGRERDAQITQALRDIRTSRVGSVKITCRLNRRQNRVIIGIINFSIERRRAAGRSDEPAVRQTRQLLRPITAERTRRACGKLLRRAKGLPPPPPA